MGVATTGATAVLRCDVPAPQTHARACTCPQPSRASRALARPRARLARVSRALARPCAPFTCSRAPSRALARPCAPTSYAAQSARAPCARAARSPDDSAAGSGSGFGLRRGAVK
eukprot:599814-Prymnesium_polylepis.1